MNKGIIKFLSCFILDKNKRHQFVYNNQPHTDIYGNKKIISGEESQEIIKSKLNSNKPFLIARFGLTEFRVLYSYIYKNTKYKKTLYNHMTSLYPTTKENMDKFAKGMLDLTQNIDVLASWHMPEEAKYCKQYGNKDTEYIAIEALDGIVYNNSWTSALKGKKVLVINPFAETIEKQYAKRELLFDNKEILPEFELKTLKPPYITKDNISMQPYSSWFEALETMEKQIETYDFDIALIGAGPFGIFLADYCKKLGKQAVVMGGCLQLLFGIMGKRWENEHPEIVALMNEHWVRPSENEKPKGFNKIERGCYW